MNATAEAVDDGLSIQRESSSTTMPDDSAIRRFAAVALEDLDAPILNLRIVDEDEGRALNRQWRDRDYATNVLSFPADLPAGTGINLLGDVVITAPVVEREARDQGKAVADHFAHLLVHGILHLRGFDHMSDSDAHEMEALEVECLARLGLNDPYQSEDD
jgi:probable rRNA maturation factor